MPQRTLRWEAQVPDASKTFGSCMVGGHERKKKRANGRTAIAEGAIPSLVSIRTCPGEMLPRFWISDYRERTYL
jgi:hypothetical protein